MSASHHLTVRQGGAGHRRDSSALWQVDPQPHGWFGAGAVAPFAVACSWTQITEKQVWQPLFCFALCFVPLFLRGL